MLPQFNELPPLSLYVHIPWCVRKCPYCDFNSHAAGTNSHAAGANSHTASSQLPEQEYIRALKQDLQQDLYLAQGRSLQSIFFGGGTPSLFSATAIGRILDSINQLLPFAPDMEITLEANPGTLEQKKFADFRQAGVNRLSIGIQSFNDAQLTKLGRIHDSNEAERAIEAARNSGFNSFNLDLMHGLPGQSTEQALFDIERACLFKPAHLSWYQLTVEPNTRFHKYPPLLPDDDTLWSIQQQGQQLLADKGYRQYEISAYSQPGQEAQHNLNYWRFGDYLGIGAGAHGKITLAASQQVVRTQKTRLPQNYLAPEKVFLAAQQSIAPQDLPGEFLMNVLRLNQGFKPALFDNRTGLPMAIIKEKLKQATEAGLLEISDHVKPTRRGLLFLNNLLGLFL